MSAILLKIKADLLSRRLLGVLILITIITSSALLTLALATLGNISGPYERVFAELNAAHVWLFFDRDLVGNQDIPRIANLPSIAKSTDLRHYVVTRAQIGDDRTWVTLRDMPPEPPAVNRLLVQEGRYLSQGKPELLANTDLKDTQQLAVGDIIKVVRSDGKEITLPVVGLVFDPMWDSYVSEQPPYLYLSEDTLQDLFPNDSTWGWALGLRLIDPDAVDELVDSVETMLHAEVLKTHFDWHDMRESALFDAQIVFVFLGTFSFFAILSTVLVIVSSVSSIVLSQFRQIGILKAIGFTQSQVLWLYLGQYLVLTLVGSPLGLLLGIVLAPLPLKSVSVSLSTSYRPPINIALMLAVLSITITTVFLATLGSAYRGARANIVRSIAVGAEAPRSKSPIIVHWATKLGMAPVLLLGTSDLFAKPFRSLMTGINLVLGVIGIVFGLTINQTVENYKADPSLLGIAYDAIISRNAFSDRKTQAILNQAPGVKAFYGESRIAVETPMGQSFKVKAIDGDLEAFSLRIEEGRLFASGTNEVIAGRGLLDWLKLKVGDQIAVHIEGEENRPVIWQIVGQYPEPVDRGRMLMVSLSPIQRLLSNAQPDTYYLELSTDYNRIELKKFLEPKDDSDLNLTFVEQVIPSYIIYLQVAIFALSIVLICIALINVFSTSLLAVREKVRVIGILKAVGMTPKQIVGMVGTTAGLLGIQSVALGIPLGLLLTNGLLEVLSANYGFGQVTTILSPLYVALLLPLIPLVSIVGSLIPGQWAAKLPIVEVLSHE